MKATPSLKEMNELYQTLYELHHDVLERGMKMYQAISPSIRRNSFRFSALNLAFYLAIRCHDLRPLQEKLLLLGLSSLGRSEARTMANLDAVIASLGRICQKQENELIAYPAPKWFFHGSRLLTHNSNLIFGSHPDASYTNIMVTMPASRRLQTGPQSPGSRHGHGTHQLRPRYTGYVAGYAASYP